MKDAQLRRMPVGDRLEPLDARELTLERPRRIEALAVNQLHRPVGSGHGTPQPDLAIAAASDDSDQGVVWDLYYRQGHANTVAEPRPKGQSAG